MPHPDSHQPGSQSKSSTEKSSQEKAFVSSIASVGIAPYQGSHRYFQGRPVFYKTVHIDQLIDKGEYKSPDEVKTMVEREVLVNQLLRRPVELIETKKTQTIDRGALPDMVQTYTESYTIVTDVIEGLDLFELRNDPSQPLQKKSISERINILRRVVR